MARCSCDSACPGPARPAPRRRHGQLLLIDRLPKARERGWGIARDDVGADTRSLALMPLLRPDVIKLDLRLVKAQPTPEIAAIAGAAGAQAERTGATVLAEGIESEEQAQYARARGATLGQGFLFGSPSSEPKPTPAVTFRCRSSPSRCMAPETEEGP